MTRPINPIFDTLETEYFTIFPDMTFVKVANLNLAFNFDPKPLFAVKKENNGSTKSLFNEEYFAHSKYSFFDEKFNTMQYCNNGWTLLKIIEPQDRSRAVFYNISDPIGEINEVSNLSLDSNEWSEYFQIRGLVNILKLINTLSKYPNWTYFELIKENLKLRKEISNLNLKLDDLKNDVKNQHGPRITSHNTEQKP